MEVLKIGEINERAKRAILVVSFGTSYKETREATIGSIEREIGAEFPDHEIRRAFTSEKIIAKLKSRDGIKIDNVDQALKKLADEDYEDVIVQPTYVVNGYEYELMRHEAEAYKERFRSILIGEPLLSSDRDYDRMIDAIADETPELKDEDTAAVFVGHGTEHCANSAYAALAYHMLSRGYKNCFVGTVEAFPDLGDVKRKLRNSGVSKVVLKPLMIVAGDHAVSDICGHGERTWCSELEKEGYKVSCEMKGLGEYSGIRRMFAERIRDAVADE